MITTTSVFEVVATIVLGVTAFCIFLWVLDAKVPCDFDCRWSAVLFP